MSSLAPTFATAGSAPDLPTICATHPVDDFGAETAALLSAVAGGARVVCVTPRPESDTLDAVVDDVEAVRRALAIDRWVYFGMSGGTFAGQVYARRHPDVIERMILASAGATFRLTVEDPACILSPCHPAWAIKLTAEGMMAGARDTDGPTTWDEVAGVGWVYRRTGGAALVVSPMVPPPRMRLMMPSLWAHDSRPWLGAIRIPTLVVCGDADPVVPVGHARALADAIVGARLAIIAGAGHVPVVEKRDQVGELVRDFLGGRGATTGS
jgi:3-oxoadipate enol-lactonase